MKEALTELRFYCICLAVLGINMQNGGLLVFSAQLIKSLGNFTVSLHWCFFCSTARSRHILTECKISCKTVK